ncbi:hypothetical protein QUF54_09480, partial [Candidatus Marithioploca araucensis]|nr:hypothetical protein [Candidatus Marithioploca araucensis]
MPSDLIVAVAPLVAVAPDEESRYIEIVFSVREMWAYHEDQVLLLVYSQKLTPYPEILTPSSMNKFQLELNTLEILGIYDIPAQSMFATPSTRVGKANPVSRSIMSFSVNLDTELLSIMMEKQDSIY